MYALWQSWHVALYTRDDCWQMLGAGHVYPRPSIYVRYVNDIGTVVEDTEAAKQMLTYLNSKHDKVRDGTARLRPIPPNS